MVINFDNIEDAENELKLLSDDEEASERSSPKVNKRRKKKFGEGRWLSKGGGY